MRASLFFLLLGAVLLAAPVPTPHQAIYACGPSGTALVKITRPPDPDRFIPSHPGSDSGTKAQSDCQLTAAALAVPGAVFALVGLVGLMGATAERRRSKLDGDLQAADGVGSPPI